MSFLPRNVVADIDLVEIEFRQSVVNEAIAVETGAGMAADTLGVETDFQMLFFARLGFGEGFTDPAAWHGPEKQRGSALLFRFLALFGRADRRGFGLAASG